MYFFLQSGIKLTFTCRPKLAIKPTGKAKNMEMFWSLLSTILLKHDNVKGKNSVENIYVQDDIIWS